MEGIAGAEPRSGDEAAARDESRVSAETVGTGTQRAAEPSKRPLGLPARSGETRGLGPNSAQAGSSSGGMVKTMLSLGAVLVLIVVLAKVAKRVAGPRMGMAASLGAAKAPSGILEILGRYSIGNGLSIILMKVDRRVLVLSQSRSSRMGVRGGGAALSTLCEIADAEDVASILTKARDAEGESIAAKFRELLGQCSGSDDETDTLEAETASTSEVKTDSPEQGSPDAGASRVPQITVVSPGRGARGSRAEAGVIA